MEEIIKPYGYIYKTTNLINGKIYIGKKESPEFDPNYKGSGKALNYAFKKHGWENFKVEYLFPCFSKEELNAEERFLIAWFDCRVKNGKGYNISEGGDWGDVSQGMTTEQYKAWCEKNRLANLGDKNHFYGKKHTEESKLKISEHHADFSGENHPMYGKHHTEESRRKMSEAKSGKYLSADSSHAKPVIQMDSNWNIIAEYKCIVDACIATGAHGSNIAKVINGKRQFAAGCRWKLKEAT